MKDKALIQNILFYVFVGVMVGIILFAYRDVPDENKEKQIVGVHVKGEVAAPGYYELDYGSRVKDAVLAAGGETENADLYSLNLAAILSDGEEVKVPAVGEKGKSGEDLININTADLYQLCKLDGIGESTARKIVEYRTKNGGFKSTKELTKIKGIGKSKFEEIKDKIKV